MELVRAVILNILEGGIIAQIIGFFFLVWFGQHLWGQTPWGKRARRQEWETRRRDLSISCTRCAKLASPIPATADRYRCPDCDAQFAGPRHDLKPLDADLEAVTP